MDMFTELEKRQEEEAKQAELHRIRRAMQWCRAYFNTRQRVNDDPRYPYFWNSLNMLQAWGFHEGVLERALNELCFSGFLTYHQTFNYYDGRRNYQHSKVYMINNQQWV